MATPPSNTPLQVGLISLGCAKNLVDAEIMLGSLLKDGFEVTNDPAAADAVIVNTCSFIDAAQEESVDAILESAEVREARNRGQALIVSGCLPQRFRDELPKLMPEVDAFMGIDQVAQVGTVVRDALSKRRQRLDANSKLRIKNSKSRVAARLAQLEETLPPASSEESAAQRHSEEIVKVEPVVADARQSPIANRQSPIVDRHSAIANRQSPIVEVTTRPTFIPDFSTPRFRLTPRHFAYVKIAEGCNHPCSFCIIPRMRGSHRSRAQSDVVAEAGQLLADGVKELNLISQDSTYYGLDLRPNHSRNIASPEKFTAAARALPSAASTLCTLLRELNALPGDFWIRLLYTHPAHWTDELIQNLASCPKVARYVDMPLQHIHDNMLERMRRETTGHYIRDLIQRIRAGVPGIALRTTFIVGFPGETEECFETLLDFIRETKFERLGVFTYSKEEGTRAAGMSGQIPDRVKKKRRARAMAEQQKVSRAVSESFVGRTLKLLVEGRASEKQLDRANVFSWEHGLLRESKIANLQSALGNYLLGRAESDAPDIDGRVFIRGKLPFGEFARVRILGHTDYDLIGEPA